MKKFVAIALAAAMAASTMPAAMAATTTKKPAPQAASHYYVAHNAKSNACEIVSEKPDGKTLTMVGKNFYKSEADATQAMHRFKSCKA